MAYRKKISKTLCGTNVALPELGAPKLGDNNSPAASPVILPHPRLALIIPRIFLGIPAISMGGASRGVVFRGKSEENAGHFLGLLFSYRGGYIWSQLLREMWAQICGGDY